jgi:hypothetical protein
MEDQTPTRGPQAIQDEDDLKRLELTEMQYNCDRINIPSPYTLPRTKSRSQNNHVSSISLI